LAPESGAIFYAKVTDLARFPGFDRQGLDRAAICITIRESHPAAHPIRAWKRPAGPIVAQFVALYREEGPVMIAIARELGVSLD